MNSGSGAECFRKISLIRILQKIRNSGQDILVYLVQVVDVADVVLVLQVGVHVQPRDVTVKISGTFCNLGTMVPLLDGSSEKMRT